MNKNRLKPGNISDRRYSISKSFMKPSGIFFYSQKMLQALSYCCLLPVPFLLPSCFHISNGNAIVIVATTNVGHLAQFVDAREWLLIN